MTDHHGGEIAALIVLIGVAAYALLSRGVARTPLTQPLLFAGLGLLLSGTLSETVSDQVAHDGKRLLAEATLIILLFADASHVRFAVLKRDYRAPLRMLAIGMPLSVLFGAAVVYALSPAGGIALALLTAAVLTPTDAALGQSVLSSPHVPERIKQSINVESGLNDGLALPLVLLGALLAAGSAEIDGIASLAATQLILGPLAGVAIGWAAAHALDWARDRELVEESAQGVLFLSTAFIAFLGAELIGGNGFISAFVAGATFGNVYRHALHFISEFMEGVGQLLTMAAFLAFGAFLLPDGLAHISVTAVLVAVLFLTVVRMGPIWLSLSGAGLDTRERLFLGWFGPRGIASILFTLIVLDEFDLPGEEELMACVSMTVGLSILAHGLTAAPLARRFRSGDGAARPPG